MYVKDRLERVRIIPFYPPLDFKTENIEKVKSQFLYVSNVVPHKNHEKLIYAFCEAFDKTKKGKIEGNSFSLKIKRALIDELIIILGKQNIPR